MAEISTTRGENEYNCAHQSCNNEPLVERSTHTSSPLTVSSSRSPSPSRTTCASPADPTVQCNTAGVDIAHGVVQLNIIGHEASSLIQERNAAGLDELPSSMNLQCPHPRALHYCQAQLQVPVCGPPLIPNYVLDPNAPEFTPVFAPILCYQAPLFMHPLFSPQPGVQVSMAAVTPPLQGSGYVDTSLRLGPPTILASPEVRVDYAGQYQEEGNYQYYPYSTFPEDPVPEAGQVNTGGGYGGDPPGMQGISPAYQDSYFMAAFNPSLLSNPCSHPVGFRAAYSHSQPATTTPISVLNTASRQPLAYKYCHYPPHGWKEHMSRSLLISGVPPDSDETQLHKELQHWGEIRSMQADRLSHGVFLVQFFDVRASRQALIDMQNQHLLRQHRFQQHLQAQSGKEFSSRLQEPRAEDTERNNGGPTGLLCGHVVWAQYVSSWALSVPDGHNQGTLVVFSIGADVDLQELCRAFEKYGDIKEIREAPTKREHKFIEFYDIRDAEAAWAALNGQELFGKCLKIEFSHQGRPMTRKSKSQSKKVLDMVAKDDTAAIFPHPYNMQGNAGRWQMASFPGCFSDPASAPLPNTQVAPELGLGTLHNGFHVTGRKVIDGVKYGETTGPRRKQVGLARAHMRGSSHGQLAQPSRAMGSFRQAPKCDLRSLPRNLMGVTSGDLHLDYDEMEVYRISGTQRTTLMVKNIPNKYSQQMLLSLLDQHCRDCNSQLMGPNEPQSAFDFVYLPIDFKNKCNLGYAFVNFTSALATLKFYKAFHAHPWHAFNSRKVCEIKYARLQGRKALEDHFKNSKFACDTADFLPLVFVPPRNGVECPLPRVAAGLMLSTRPGRTSIIGQQALLEMPDAQGLINPAGHHCTSLAAQNEQLAESTFTDRDSTCSSTDDESGPA